VSRKIERLVNLTIALLATKRFLTKSEIFRTVDGYEGTPETKERMFERDKDDLRALGIDIEVGSFDPIFLDEAGYRINQAAYQMDLGVLSPMEISLLSLAAQSWQGAALDDAAHRVLLKIRSLGEPMDGLELPAISSRLANSSDDIAIIGSAIADRSIINFSYTSTDFRIEPRTVIPFSLATHRGFWYVASVDQEKNDVRVFRLDRISGGVLKGSQSSGFIAPMDFDFHQVLTQTHSNTLAVFDVRKGKGQILRNLAISSKDLGEWDQIEIPVISLENLRSLALWHEEDVFVRSPQELVDMIVDSLQKIVATHG
jgi:proteasome accessory factor B